MGSRLRFTVICLTGCMLLLTALSVDTAYARRSNNRRKAREYAAKAKRNAQQGKYEAAWRDIVSSITRDPNNEENLYFAALLEYKIGRPSMALTRCSKILKNNRSRKYRDKTLKLQRIIQDSMNTGQLGGKQLRGSSMTMLYTTAMKNQKNFVDSGYNNVVQRVNMAKRNSLSPVRARTVANAKAYDMLIGKEKIPGQKATRPATQYAKAIVDDLKSGSFAADTAPDASENLDTPATADTTDSDGDVNFDTFDINDDNTSDATADNMRPVENTTSVEAPDTGNSTDTSSDEGGGFSDFGDNSSDTATSDSAPDDGGFDDFSAGDAKDTASDSSTSDDDGGFGDFGDDNSDDTPAEEPKKDEPAADDDSGFGDFGDDSSDDTSAEEPKKDEPAADEDSGFGDFGDDSSSSDSDDDSGFGDFGDDSEKKEDKAPAKAPEKKEDEGLDGFGDFGDDSSEDKEKAEEKDDASDDGFGDFGDDSDNSGGDDEGFGSFDDF